MAVLPSYIVPNSIEFRDFLESKQNNIPVPSIINVSSIEFRDFLSDANTGTLEIPSPGVDINSTEYRDFLDSL